MCGERGKLAQKFKFELFDNFKKKKSQRDRKRERERVSKKKENSTISNLKG